MEGEDRGEQVELGVEGWCRADFKGRLGKDSEPDSTQVSDLLHFHKSNPASSSHTFSTTASVCVCVDTV